MPFIEGEASNDGGRFLYQGCRISGSAYGRNGKVIGKDTLKLFRRYRWVFGDEYTEDFWKIQRRNTAIDATFMEYY